MSRMEQLRKGIAEQRRGIEMTRKAREKSSRDMLRNTEAKSSSGKVRRSIGREEMREAEEERSKARD